MKKYITALAALALAFSLSPANSQSIVGPPEESDLTPVQKEARNILQSSGSVYNDIRNRYNMSASRVWENPRFTPQELIDELNKEPSSQFGTMAAELFARAQMLAQMLQAQYPNDPLVKKSPPEGWTVAVGQDGKVTLTPPPPTIPSPTPPPIPLPTATPAASPSPTP
jgi:hypothetical protein